MTKQRWKKRIFFWFLVCSQSWCSRYFSGQKFLIVFCPRSPTRTCSKNYFEITYFEITVNGVTKILSEVSGPSKGRRSRLKWFTAYFVNVFWTKLQSQIWPRESCELKNPKISFEASSKRYRENPARPTINLVKTAHIDLENFFLIVPNSRKQQEFSTKISEPWDRPSLDRNCNHTNHSERIW